MKTEQIIKKAVDIAKNLHNGTLINGTYNIYTGKNANLSSGYMVATNNNLIPNKRPFLGVWFDDIELSFCIKSKKKALEVAIYFNQTAIYDNKNNREIYTKKFIDVSQLSQYQKAKLRKKEGFRCISDNKAFFSDSIDLYFAITR